MPRGELPEWNPTIFLGTPLLAAYRPGALLPASCLSWPSCRRSRRSRPSSSSPSPLPRSSSSSICDGWARSASARSWAGSASRSVPTWWRTSADTATLVAAPLLPLVLLAAEDHMRRGTAARAAGLAVSLALLLLAGSPEAARAGVALVAGRLVVGHVLMPSARGPSVRASLLALLAAGLLAAPQLVPTLVLARDAGRSVTGLANRGSPFGRAVRPRPALRVAHARGRRWPWPRCPWP